MAMVATAGGGGGGGDGWDLGGGAVTGDAWIWSLASEGLPSESDREIATRTPFGD
jgi:hypothetical protein